MAELAYIKLDEDGILAGLREVSGWSVDGDQLNKTFTFDSYLAGVEFVVKVGNLAETLNHHPDIHLYWRKAVVSMTTHDVRGLSPYDFELAKLIDRM